MVTKNRLTAIIIALTLAFTACSSNNDSDSSGSDGADAAGTSGSSDGASGSGDGVDGDGPDEDDGWTGPDWDDDPWPETTDPADFDIDTEFGPHKADVLDVVEHGFGVHRNMAGEGTGTAAVLLQNSSDETVSGYRAVFIFKDADGEIVGVEKQLGRTLEAGQSGYLGTIWTALSAQPASLEVHTILPEESFWEVSGTAVDITIDGVENDTDAGQSIVRGTVENTTSDRISVTVSCALRNADGDIKGFAANQPLEVERGETADWEALGHVPVKTADCTATTS